SLSGGQRQCVAIARAVTEGAPLVILDEPTSNLDPTVRREVTAMIDEARQDGRTILLSSHVMSEVEDACDRVAILRGGQLVHLQNLSELRRQHRIRAALAGTIPAIPDALESHVTVRPCDEPGYLIIDVQDDLSSVLGWISTLALQEVRVEPYGLQSVYDRFHPPTHVPRGTARSTISAAATT
ncbi:MAG: ATP-binding cassette domain-containing protein, partial [Planctomycetales bacterium]|nr:ATP-binding cassette domain-containing protein [Planctomycetales bacterium]